MKKCTIKFYLFAFLMTLVAPSASANANASEVSPKLEVSTAAAGAKGATWTFEFTLAPNGALAGGDSLSIQFPLGTGLTQYASMVDGFMPYTYVIHDLTTNANFWISEPELASGSWGDTSAINVLKLNLPAFADDNWDGTGDPPPSVRTALSAGDRIQIVILGVTNSKTIGAQSIQLTTSKDSTGQLFNFETYSAQSVSKVSSTFSTMKGRSKSTWTIKFTASPNGGLVYGSGAINVSVPIGSSYNWADDGISNFYTLTNESTGEVSRLKILDDWAEWGNKLKSLTIPVTVTVKSGDNIKLVFPIFNGDAKNQNTVVSTSSDYIDAASPNWTFTKYIAPLYFAGTSPGGEDGATLYLRKGGTYRFQLIAQGGVRKYTWLTDGPMLPGFKLNRNGILSGKVIEPITCKVHPNLILTDGRKAKGGCFIKLKVKDSANSIVKGRMTVLFI